MNEREKIQLNENQILNKIKFLPPLFIILLSIMFTFFLYYENERHFTEDTKKLELNYTKLNKRQIKSKLEMLKENIEYEKFMAFKALKKTLKTQVNNSWHILQSVYEKNKDKSRDEILQMTKDVLRHLKFNDRNYIFINSLSGVTLFHPKKKYLENKSFWDVKDSKGVYFAKEVYKRLKKEDEIFFTWYWKKEDSSTKDYKKIGFFKKFEPLGVYIVSSEYIDDFESEIKAKILKEISLLKYNDDRSYVFVLDKNGIFLEHYNGDYIGRMLYEKETSKNVKKVFSQIKEKSKKGGFVSYKHKLKTMFDKYGPEKSVIKHTYIIGIDDWDWIIGTGFYMDDFYKEAKLEKEKLLNENRQQIQQILLVNFIITLIMLFVSFSVSNKLEKRFLIYQKSIEEQINDNIIKDNLLAYQSKMAALGEMLGNIAHQWRQPLSTISTIVTGLKIQKQMGLNSENELESLDIVNNHVQYLSHTIDDFRNYYKVQKEPKSFKISSAIKKAIDLVVVQFRTKSIVIEENIEDVEMYGLENELIQVLINILNNARDELVKINDKHRHIFVETKVRNNTVNIKIKDNAGGIPENLIQKIFEPYFSTKLDEEGTGIGLFMSEEIVTKHLKGNIFVSNDTFNIGEKVYKGAEFTIFLPLEIKKQNLKKL